MGDMNERRNVHLEEHIDADGEFSLGVPTSSYEYDLNNSTNEKIFLRSQLI